MSLRFIFLILMMLPSVSVLCAQEKPLPAALERRMNLQVIDAVMKLKDASDVTDRQSAREFIGLFENEETPVFCDLYSSEDFLSQIPVSEYAELFLNKDGSSKFTGVSYEFKDIRKLGWSFSESRWYCSLSVTKSLNYFDTNFIYYPLSVQNPSGTDFEITITVAFNKECTDCRIAEIACRNNVDFESIQSRYYVIQKNDFPADAKRDDNIKIGGRHIKFNEYGQAYAPKANISYWDDDIKVMAITKSRTDAYEYVQFKYQPRYLRLRLRNEYAPISAYSFSGMDDFCAKESSAYTIGVDIGYSTTISKAFKLGFYTGIGMAFSHISLKTPEFAYSYSFSLDKDVSILRSYDIDYVSQKVKYMDLVVPVFLSPEFKIHKAVSIFADLGAKVYLNTNAVAEPLYIHGDVSGTYSDGTPVLNGFYGIGNLDGPYNEFVSAVTFKRTPVDVTLFGNIGIDVNLYAKTIYMQLKAGYEYGLTWSYKSSESVFFNSSGIYPLTYSGEYNRDILLRPFADCISFRRQALWIGLGVMIKL